MARRKRLSLSPLPGRDLPAPDASSLIAPRAPIAQVAGEASASHALGELAEQMRRAREDGRLVQMLSHDAVDEGHLIRDRIAATPEDMADLVASISERGQQAPIEVVALDGGRFGLISGWRRLSALRHLHARTGDARFAQVAALLRRPANAADAYRAMVEENEIRANLSFYERARIAARAAEAGIYPDARRAVSALFTAAPRARRSKIGSFLVLYQALDDRLRFAPSISERLGLALSRALDADPTLALRLRERLRKSAPRTAEAEMALLERALRQEPEAPAERPPAPDAGSPQAATAAADPCAAASPRDPHREQIRPGVWLETSGGFSKARLTLSGDKVDGPLRDRLVSWLRANP